MPPSSNAVSFSQDGNVGIVTLQFAPHNLVGRDLCSALIESFNLAAAAGCRAVVLHSSLRHFSAGADLGLFENGGARLNDELDALGVLRAFDEAPFPIIASVHGVALGGGLRAGAGCRPDRRISVCQVRPCGGIVGPTPANGWLATRH